MTGVGFVGVVWDHWHGFLSGYQHATAWALMALILRGRTELQNENQYSGEYQDDMA